MANGTIKESIARADRMRERQEQDRKATRNALEGLRRVSSGVRELQPYRESDSEITANTQGLHARGIPRFAWWMLGLGIMIFISAAGVALVVALL
jgi:hypothetical protein